MTHDTWNKAIKRGLTLAATEPERALQILQRLARNVEAQLETGLQDWHLAQTRSIVSLVQAGIGDHRAAAKTLRTIAVQHARDLKYHQRGFVSVCAAVALELAKIGDRAGARRMLKIAGPLASALRPKDKLLEHAWLLVSSRVTKRR